MERFSQWSLDSANKGKFSYKATAQMLSGGIKGMLGALKGMVPGGEVIIRMKG